MRGSHRFEVQEQPDKVAAFLSEPRNILMANHRAPVVDASEDGPPKQGSWRTFALDQLRVRVEYTVFDPPRRIAASVTMTGRGAHGQRADADYRLTPGDEPGSTRVDVELGSTGGWMPEAVQRLYLPLHWRLLARKIRRGVRATRV